jgi:putative transposase
VSEVFAFIAAEKANYPVALMCRALEVNRTSFHDWERRPPSDRSLQDAWLLEQIKQIHETNRRVYGAPRIHAELRLGRGIRVGRKRVERLMKSAGVSGLVAKKYGRTTIRVPGVRVADDLVERQFRPSTPNVLWLADITYLRTWEGWLYLAAVQDAYSRRIVGWSMADHMRAELVVDALTMAVHRRRPDPGVIHHSDQGSPIRQPRLRPGRTRRRNRDLDGLPRRRLRQCRRRELLRDAQERARPPPLVADQTRARLRGVRVHRSVLQPRAPTLNARHALTRPIRAALRAARLRCAEQGSPDHRQQVKKCRLNRGKSTRNLLKAWPTLWTFADRAGVQPTNNHAERALRSAVIYRKLSLGSQSRHGEQRIERLLSASITCRLQLRSLFVYLAELLDNHTRGKPLPALA